jgi:DNA-binding Xre family transcriptional regulator
MTCVIALENVMDTHTTPQFSIEAIAYFKWDREQSAILKNKRLDKLLSRKELSAKIATYGIVCSLQYIDKLENGNAESIKSDKFLAILKALNANIQDFYPHP